MQNFTKFWELTTVQRSALWRSRRELSNAYLIAKFGFDTAETEPSKVCSPPVRAASKRLRSAARQLNDLDPEAHDVTPKVWLILTCNYKLWNWNDSRVLPIKIRFNSISNFVIEASQGLDCLYMNFGIASEMSTYLAWFESQMRIAIGIISATGELEITVGA